MLCAEQQKEEYLFCQTYKQLYKMMLSSFNLNTIGLIATDVKHAMRSKSFDVLNTDTDNNY